MEEFCSKDPRSFPSIQENLRFSRVPSISWAPDKVQSCFAVKETAFQFGCSNLPTSRSRSCTCMVGQSQCPEFKTCFERTASATIPAFVSSPKVRREAHYLYFNSLQNQLPSLPLHFSRQHDATYLRKYPHPHCPRRGNHLSRCSSWDSSHGYATSGKRRAYGLMFWLCVCLGRA